MWQFKICQCHHIVILNFLLIKCLDVLYVCVRHAHTHVHTHTYTTYQLYYYYIEYGLSRVLSNSLSIIYLVVNVILVYKFLYPYISK
jgi:hypothetical protein